MRILQCDSLSPSVLQSLGCASCSVILRLRLYDKVLDAHLAVYYFILICIPRPWMRILEFDSFSPTVFQGFGCASCGVILPLHLYYKVFDAHLAVLFFLSIYITRSWMRILKCDSPSPSVFQGLGCASWSVILPLHLYYKVLDAHLAV